MPGREENLLLSDLDSGGVLVLTMNRPEAYNALSVDLIHALTGAVRAAMENRDVRVIVLRGAGRGFSAGHDLAEVLSFESDDEHRALLESCAAMMQLLDSCPKPVIAAIHGSAFAAGCQLVATVDLAFAEETARFSTPGVNIGLFCSTPMVALSRAVSSKRSLRMLLTGAPISAAEAAAIGLINEAVPSERLDETVMSVAREIASKSSYVVQLGKAAFKAQKGMELADAYSYCNEVVVENLKARDASEGISAFLEKRDPEWSDS
ncbi:enoyl-CoA hydratase [Oceanibacterium hippocampi]|uniref:Enoyl-CoA hydratase domain-containing protein 3, mitochondrial n=1 Tax=Oceanibacterium hippocampi TaxID=745714 RepID=A0A1Y5U158_9PROT|nr:enoyl-CoA hydratase [Oceanibacterium hippocampi]SLN77706.1 2,3-dehydroadipyl-CoA hydratase [Oceanibacterium hippocampi]